MFLVIVLLMFNSFLRAASCNPFGRLGLQYPESTSHDVHDIDNEAMTLELSVYLTTHQDLVYH